MLTRAGGFASRYAGISEFGVTWMIPAASCCSSAGTMTSSPPWIIVTGLLGLYQDGFAILFTISRVKEHFKVFLGNNILAGDTIECGDNPVISHQRCVQLRYFGISNFFTAISE